MMRRTAPFLFILGFLAIGSLHQSASGQIVPGQGGRVDPDQLSKFGGPADRIQAAKDRLFLRKASEDGLAEIQLSQLALTKSSRDDVKSFAQTMINDHTKLNATLKPIADSMEASTAKKLAKPDQAEYTRLNGLSGADFDKEYLAYLLKAHQASLQAFKDEAAATTDPTLGAAVQSGGRMIGGHLAMLQKLTATS